VLKQDQRPGMVRIRFHLHVEVWTDTKMIGKEIERLKMAAEVFKAMGQPIRLEIIEMLHSDEMQVGRIAAKLGTDASNVSKHLSLLRKQGLVVDRKEGPSIFYRGTIPHLMGFMWCVDKAVRQRLDAQVAAHTLPSGVSEPSHL
jgi:DNA-binding transcriptional ArsR family regulator